MRRTLLIALVLLAVAPAAEAHDRTEWHRSQIAFEPRTTVWQSQHRVTRDDPLEFILRHRRHDLHYEADGECVAHFWGEGIAGRIEACRGRIRIRLVSLTGRRGRIVFAWRVNPERDASVEMEADHPTKG